MCLSLSYRRFTVRCGYKSDLNDKIQNHHGNQCTSKVSQLKEIIHHLLALIFQTNFLIRHITITLKFNIYQMIYHAS